jgi:hypothetical protein
MLHTPFPAIMQCCCTLLPRPGTYRNVVVYNHKVPPCAPPLTLSGLLLRNVERGKS